MTTEASDNDDEPDHPKIKAIKTKLPKECCVALWNSEEFHNGMCLVFYLWHSRPLPSWRSLAVPVKLDRARGIGSSHVQQEAADDPRRVASILTLPEHELHRTCICCPRGSLLQ